MSVCEEIYRDPRHNDRDFAAMMAQRKKEEIIEGEQPNHCAKNLNGGRKLKYTPEQLKEKQCEWSQNYRAKKKAERLLAQANGSEPINTNSIRQKEGYCQ